MKKTSLCLPLVATCMIVGASIVSAQPLFENSLDSSTGWTLNHEGDSSDNYVTFGFDYSAFGIPEAPNSKPGDTATSGLQIITNRDFGETNSVSASPTGMSFSGKFTYQFDMWLNAVGPFPLGGSGSTEFGGGSVGYDNSAGTPLSGGTFVVTGEAGSSNDYRLYAHDEFQLFSTHVDPTTLINDLYGPDMESGNANDELPENVTYTEGLFPGVEAPLLQQQTTTPATLDQSGTTLDGAAGFQWMTVKFTVDTDAGTAKVEMTSAASGNTGEIGTFTLDNTYVDRDTIDTKLITSLEGNVSLIYRDLFTSLIDEDLVDYSFGLFDNVIVEEISDTVEVLLGDADNDLAVSGSDLLAVTNNFGNTGDADGLLLGDADDDGSVSGSDLLAVTNNFGATLDTASLTAANVPEPTTGLLLVLAAGGLTLGRKLRG